LTVSDLSERDLIARVRSRLPPPPPWLVVGIGDDAAVIEPERNRLDVLSVDAMVDQVHFDRRFTPPDAIGYRALAVNVSDLAAMGASPRFALLSMALPPALPIDDFDAIVTGFVRGASRYRLQVVGGNLTRTPGPLVIDVTAAGSVKRRVMLTRAGARPGDEVYVSGSLAAAAAGLQALQAGAACQPDDPCISRYLYPEPRLRLTTLLARNRAATACMDLSDGLADGLAQIAETSGVGMLIDAAALPIEPAARRWFESVGKNPLDETLRAGDDYEVLFTARPRHRGRLRPLLRDGSVAITRIGTCTADGGVVLRRTMEGGTADTPIPAGFSHFGRSV
jgi:thiamine-monophosphate kinase